MEHSQINDVTVETIIEHHFGKKPKKVSHLSGGLSNFVYEAVMTEKDKYVIRLCDVPQKINYFIKEQWAVAQARERGVPTPEILEVDNQIIQYPYMVLRKVEGRVGNEASDRRKVVFQMGKYLSMINNVPTHGFGHVFDWSNNTLSKRETWKDYLDKEWMAKQRIELLEKEEILTKDNIKKLKAAFKELELLDLAPHLNHGDMRLKNVLVNDESDIVAVLDWENCQSNLAPHWDLAIALHDLTIDEKEAFLEGYGMREKDYIAIAPLLNVINILGYTPYITANLEQKNQKALDQQRLRLNGHLDLYSF